MPSAPVIVCFFLGFTLFIARRLQRSPQPRPPGPKPWPLIGNVLDIPLVRPWITYRDWSKIYASDTVSISVPGMQIVVLNSFKAATDLLEKKSQIYSDRPPSILTRLLGLDFSVVGMPYSPYWRAHRKVFHQHFQQSVVGKYHSLQLHQVRACLVNIKRSPHRIPGHVRHMANSGISAVMYGNIAAVRTEEYVQWAENTLQAATKAFVPGAYPVELIPFLRFMPRWFPGTKHHELIEYYKPSIINLRDKPFEAVKVALKNGSTTPDSSVLASLLGEIREKRLPQGEETEQLDIARNVAATGYGAAVDTTVSYCQSFLLAMALYPEVQARAQAELDRIVGQKRLPEFDDLANLVYIRAVIMETLRWMPVTPLGFPHTLTAEDVYEGYYLPKGTTVIANMWSILRDPSHYPDPDSFSPERFIGHNSQLDSSVLDPIDVVFGFGRRICAGKYYGLDSVSMFIASALHVFDVSAGKDDEGRTVHLADQTTDNPSLLSFPITTPHGIALRFEAAAQLLSEY